jgi:hypothetical protein
MAFKGLSRLWLWLTKTDYAFRLVGFAFTTIGLLPISVYAVSRQSGLNVFTATVLAGVSLAVGLRLVRWWLRVAKRPWLRA